MKYVWEMFALLDLSGDNWLPFKSKWRHRTILNCFWKHYLKITYLSMNEFFYDHEMQILEENIMNSEALLLMHFMEYKSAWWTNLLGWISQYGLFHSRVVPNGDSLIRIINCRIFIVQIKSPWTSKRSENPTLPNQASPKDSLSMTQHWSLKLPGRCLHCLTCQKIAVFLYLILINQRIETGCEAQLISCFRS